MSKVAAQAWTCEVRYRSRSLRAGVCCGIALALGVSVPGSTHLFAQQPNVQAPRAGAVAPAEPTFHLLRSVCGSKGSQKGDRFVMEDPRSVFYLPEDKQVMIYFEWEGPTGQHHFEGFWKDPEGKVVVLSDFSYEAKQKRFAGYWTLPLTDTMKPGMWALEAHVDGELAGSYNFQVTVAPRPPLPSARPVLSPAELYKQLLPATVSVEKLDAQGRRIGFGSGFIVEGNLVVTTFTNVESASAVRVTTASGMTGDVHGLAAWNRREDWAVLRLPASLNTVLVAAKAGEWQIGDVCYSLDSPQEGNRTIVRGHITGNHPFPDVGERLNLDFQMSPRATGSPVVTEYGEVIGIAASASLVPGLGSLDVSKQGEFPQYPSNLAGEGLTPGFGALLAVPMKIIKTSPPMAPVTTFADMMSSGQFLQNLNKNPNLQMGTLGRAVERYGQSMSIKDARFEFQRQDRQLSVLITWLAQGKFRYSPVLRIYDMDNKMVGTSEPMKVNLSKGQVAYSSWTLSVSRLSPGFYRMDLVLDSAPIWRTFFRITE